MKNQTEKKFPGFSFRFSLVIKMVLGLFKWSKETSFYNRNKKIITKTSTLPKMKVQIKKKRRKEEYMNFQIKEKLIF